jgi:hypothetical protein
MNRLNNDSLDVGPKVIPTQRTSYMYLNNPSAYQTDVRPSDNIPH